MPIYAANTEIPRSRFAGEIVIDPTEAVRLNPSELEGRTTVTATFLAQVIGSKLFDAAVITVQAGMSGSAWFRTFSHDSAAKPTYLNMTTQDGMISYVLCGPDYMPATQPTDNGPAQHAIKEISFPILGDNSRIENGLVDFPAYFANCRTFAWLPNLSELTNR